MYHFNHLTFLAPIDPTDQSLNIINVNGNVQYILRDPSCKVLQVKNTLRIKQSISAETITLDFANDTVAKLAHNQLRGALTTLNNNTTNNNTTQNNIITVYNVTNGCSVETDSNDEWKIDESKVKISIENKLYFTPPKVVQPDEIFIINVALNFYSDINDINSFKFSEIRKYILKSGKGSYTNITLNQLELLSRDKQLKFIQLEDIDFSNKAGLILTVNSNEDSVEYKNISDFIADGISTEYVIDLEDNNKVELVLNSKLILTGLTIMSGTNHNIKINGATPIFPITLNSQSILNPITTLKISCSSPVIFNLNVIQFIF